ncbi:hypothetical protein Syun_004329 [Stephania yunnanensis]|uniref:Uncharacterized protein n=1 Tax=Stephania yunnanensis TaxID=152371 RepID=A0AAP0L4B9_9MAGN
MAYRCSHVRNWVDVRPTFSTLIFNFLDCKLNPLSMPPSSFKSLPSSASPSRKS